MTATAPTFAEVLDLLQEIAPLELAADWDNVGLLLAPRALRGPVKGVLLTIDLTAAVVAEAARARCPLVVSYHPPIFQPLRQLLHEDPRQQVVLAAIAAGLAVWSPHTALDAAPSGIADWLAEGVLGSAAPESLRPCGDGEFGRLVEFAKPVGLGVLLPRIKRLLGVRSLQVAGPAGARRKIRSVAMAAGSGGSVLRGQDADLWLTGELGHHDALAAAAAGVTVVVAGHSNTERGYLRLLRKRLMEPYGGALEVRVAKGDVDPFVVV